MARASEVAQHHPTTTIDTDQYSQVRGIEMAVTLWATDESTCTPHVVEVRRSSLISIVMEHVTKATLATFLGLAAQIIPVLILAVVVDARRNDRSLEAARSRERPATSIARNAAVAIVATVIAGVGELAALAGVLLIAPTPDKLDWQKDYLIMVPAFVALSILFLLYALFAPHLGTHLPVLMHYLPSLVIAQVHAMFIGFSTAGLSFSVVAAGANKLILLLALFGLVLGYAAAARRPFFFPESFYDEADKRRWGNADEPELAPASTTQEEDGLLRDERD